jgi:HlyD family secretion protein
MDTPPPAAAETSTSTEKKSNANLATLLDEPANQRWYRRPALWGSIALVLLIAAGVWYWRANDTANAAPTYTTQAAARGDLTLTVTANGTMQPTRTINIGSELSGTVLKVNVDVNDRIKKGQVLVELDTAKLRDQIKRSRASVSAANAKVAQTAATVKEASASLGRFEDVARLSGGKVPSKAELDSARASVERAKADAASANAGVTDAIAALSTDEINLSKASIVAPTDGVVLTRSVEPGNAVAASLQAVTLFSVAEDLAQLRLQVYVDEADVGTVAIGQKASFTVSAYAGRKFPAEITRVAFSSTITDNVVTYLTYLGVDNTDLSLRPGMTATATITATQRKDVLLVPNSALRFTPSMTSAMASANGLAGGTKSGGGGNTGKPAAKSGIVASLVPRIPRGNTRGSAPGGASTAAARQVWVLRDEVAVAVAVVPGISDGRMTEIVSGDLEAGMLVITDQKSTLSK